MCFIPLTAAWEMAKVGSALGDKAVSEPEGWQKKGHGAEPERPLLPHSDMKPPHGPGSDDEFDLVSKQLLFRGLLEVSALLLFWRLS